MVMIPATSTEFLHVTVTAPNGVDITSSPPRLAVLPAATRGNPTADDWHTGEWTDGTTARLLVGPDGGALTLEAGSYRVFVTFDPPGSENPVRLSGYIGIS